VKIYFTQTWNDILMIVDLVRNWGVEELRNWETEELRTKTVVCCPWTLKILT
jgi:hypothetical protein